MRELLINKLNKTMIKKQDILKLHPMIGRLTPTQWDEIHKAMDSYLNEYKAKQLTLTDVSKQRELLLGFQKSEYFDSYEQGVLEYKDAIEKYLA